MREKIALVLLLLSWAIGGFLWLSGIVLALGKWSTAFAIEVEL